MKTLDFKKFIKKTTAVLCIAVCLFSFILPLVSRFSGGETYRCVWSDGAVTTESYSSAYAALYGMDEGGVVLYRDGKLGRIAARNASLCAALETGSLNEILYRSAENAMRIERAALYRTYSKRIWYEGDFFVWNGERVERARRATGEELVLLSGGISARTLQNTGVKTVYLRAGAEVKANTFSATRVETVYAQPPYAANGGAVYFTSAGGKRLISALGTVKTLALDADLSYVDEGALLSCTELEALSLPFVGNAADSAGSAFIGELAYLFSDGKEYLIPASLKRVMVTGGTLVSHAFYRCDNLYEIDACGVEEENISSSAFDGLPALRVLHSPKELSLSGFTSSVADCGCTVYTRIA